jgi:outer membrane protein assembly factor BamB/tetratricopeptide (TPR) repeat protein
MALKGDLASVELAQVFQMLALNHKVGLLSIEGPARDRALYFDQRGVTLRFFEHGLMERAVASAVRSGRVTEDAVAQVQTKSGGSALQVCDALLLQAVITEEELAELCRAQIEEDIYEAFLWKDAHFEFLENTSDLPGREGKIDDRFFFSPDFLIMEAARRLDEWESIREKIPTVQEVFEAIPDAAATCAADLTPEHLAVLDTVDGFRTVSRIVQTTGCASFQVHKALMHLIDSGVVVPVAAENLPGRAQDCLVQGRNEDALLLFEKSIEQGIEIPESHCAAALVYEEQSERSSACFHWKCYAEFLVEAGKKADAAETLLRVRNLLPTDIQARERMVEMAAHLPVGVLGEVDPFAEGKFLAELLVEMGENDRARALLEQLLAGRTADLELKKCLVAVHSRTGDTRRVLELHESIADTLVQAGDPIGAVKYLQKILLFDKSRTDISERIRKLYVMDERRRLRKRGLMMALSAVLLLVLMGSCYALYESHARGIYVTIPSQADDLVHGGDYAAARQLHQDFLDRYPFSLVASRARGEIRRISDLEREWQTEQEEVRRRQENDQERVRDRYRGLWNGYQASEKVGHARDLVASLEVLDRIDELVRSINAEQDQTWAAEVKLADLRLSLREHLLKAEALASEARKALAAGKVAEARAMVERLHTEFVLTPIARKLPMPVRLESYPSGARVFVDGKPLVDKDGRPAQTPAIFDVPFDGSRSVRLEHEGHSPVECQVTSKSLFVTSVSMFVLPQVDVPLAKGAAGLLASDASSLVTSAGGSVSVIDLNSNAVRSRRTLPTMSDLAVPPVLCGNRLLCASSDGTLVGYPAGEGDPVWKRKFNRPARGGIAEKDGYVYFGDDSGRVRCVGMDHGDVVWERDLGEPMVKAPALRGKDLFVATRGNRLHCLRSDDGEPKWSQTTSAEVSATPVPLQEGFVVATADGRVGYWLDPGQPARWTWQSKSPRGVDTVAASGDSVFVCAAGRIVRLSLAKGEPVAAAELGGYVLRGPTMRGDQVLLLLERRTDDFLLVAMGASDFHLAWQFRTGQRVIAGPHAGNSRVWVATDDGHVLGFK